MIMGFRKANKRPAGVLIMRWDGTRDVLLDVLVLPSDIITAWLLKRLFKANTDNHDYRQQPVCIIFYIGVQKNDLNEEPRNSCQTKISPIKTHTFLQQALSQNRPGKE
jgi:hypothetical protein